MNNPINYQTIIDELITTRRLSSYKRVFAPQTNEELVAIYLWNINVCSSIYSLLNIAEICLRNSIDRALVQKYRNFWWSRSTIKYSSFVPGNPPPKVIKDIQSNFAQAFTSVKAEKADRYGLNFKQVTPTHEEIVAKTDFSVWENLLDNEFMGNNLIWPSLLGSVFKGNWGTPLAAKFLADTKDLVKAVRLLRNRVSHHEPVWKKHNINNEAQALKYINDVIDKILKLIETIDPEMTKLIDCYQIIARARCLATKEYLDSYRS